MEVWSGRVRTRPSSWPRQAFAVFDVVDVTAEYEVTVAAWIREWTEGRAELEPLVGAEMYDERQARRVESLEAIRNGLRKRFLITGRAGRSA